MSLDPSIQVLAGLLIASAMMLGLWLIQLRTRNAGVVDVGWAGGIGVVGIFYAVTSDGDLARRYLVGVLVGAWSARLAIYLLLNRVVGRPEEGRYVTLRKAWGTKADFRLLLFFQAQAVLVLLFALPARRRLSCLPADHQRIRPVVP